MLAFCVTLMSSAFSCEKSIINTETVSVEDVFNEKYPGATMVEWERHANYYEVEFFYNGHEMEAHFDKDGKWLWTKTEVRITEVPATVIEAAKNYDNGKWEIDDIDYYERSSGEREYYKVELEQRRSDIEKTIYIRPDGSIFDLRP